MSDNDECKGCAEYEIMADTQNCQFARLNKYQNICPCTFCLVKSMCNTSCDLYKTFEEDMHVKGMLYEE